MRTHFSTLKLLIPSAHHPQTDGLTERGRNAVKQMLGDVVNADLADRTDYWDASYDYLDTMESAYNNSPPGSAHSLFY